MSNGIFINKIDSCKLQDKIKKDVDAMALFKMSKINIDDINENMCRWSCPDGRLETARWIYLISREDAIIINEVYDVLKEILENDKESNVENQNDSINDSGNEYLINLHLGLPPYNRMERTQAINEIKKHLSSPSEFACFGELDFLR